MACVLPLRAGTVINFNGSAGDSLTLLDDASYFSELGVSFESDTYLLEDARFFAVGGDDWGIITRASAPDNTLAVVFNQGAYSVTFDWFAMWSNDFFAIIKDFDGNVLGEYSALDLPASINYGQGTLASETAIRSIEFHDGKGFIGVGRLEYLNAGLNFEPSDPTLAPLPSAAWGGLGVLGLLGITHVVRSRRRQLD